MSDILALEEQLKSQKALVERRDEFLKLVQNPLFKKLILEDFVVQEAARLVALSADPNLDANQRADALSMAQAAGHLKRYLEAAGRMGDLAERNTIPEIESVLEEMRANGEDENELSDAEVMN